MKLTRTQNRLIVETVQSYATFQVWDERTGVFRGYKLLAEHETDIDLVIGYIPDTVIDGLVIATEVVETRTGTVDVIEQAALEAYDRFHPDSKINAIKAVREATGIGLKEAKDAVDKIWDLHPERRS